MRREEKSTLYVNNRTGNCYGDEEEVSNICKKTFALGGSTIKQSLSLTEKQLNQTNRYVIKNMRHTKLLQEFTPAKNM